MWTISSRFRFPWAKLTLLARVSEKRKQSWCHPPELPANGADRQVTQVDPIHRHPTLLRIIEAQHQVDQSGLAAAGAPQDA